MILNAYLQNTTRISSSGFLHAKARYQVSSLHEGIHPNSLTPAKFKAITSYVVNWGFIRHSVGKLHYGP